MTEIPEPKTTVTFSFVELQELARYLSGESTTFPKDAADKVARVFAVRRRGMLEARIRQLGSRSAYARDGLT